MNIALIGYGKMGRRLHALAKEHNITVGLVVIGKLNKDGASIREEKFTNIDLAIDFSHPDGVVTNIRKLTELGVPVVVGTTGWCTEESEQEVTALSNESEVPVLYGSNFSLGVQLYLKIIEQAAASMGRLSEFKASFHEVHHMDKADAPSGTAQTAATIWKKHVEDTATTIEYGISPSVKPTKEAIYITSQRIPGVYGEHELRIRSPFDDIRISHTALSRDAFAAGALKAAHWLKQQSAGFYKLEDVVEDILRKSDTR
ncbi:MAG: 4-hydroxy-tetrahydrodipicolinate reductase [Bacteroidetes bacterium]|nr:4-hydroxy-tetrahydrodipicolinate reductase [Bacteroidota bacterium]MCH8523662.1 4-hydroxy-tetrahydrodipicolinate reductase [Balneolales bacterium]